MTTQEYKNLRPHHNNTVLVTTQDIRIGKVNVPKGAYLTPLRKWRGKVVCSNHEDLGGYVFELPFPLQAIAIQYTTSEALRRSSAYSQRRVRKSLQATRIAKSKVMVDSTYPLDAMVRRDGSYLNMNERLMVTGTHTYYLRFWNWNPRKFGVKRMSPYIDGVVTIEVTEKLKYYSGADLVIIYDNKRYKLPRKYITNLRSWNSGFIEELPDTERVFFNPNNEL